jgi:hypothetical protein
LGEHEINNNLVMYVDKLIRNNWSNTEKKGGQERRCVRNCEMRIEAKRQEEN